MLFTSFRKVVRISDPFFIVRKLWARGISANHREQKESVQEGYKPSALSAKIHGKVDI